MTLDISDVKRGVKLEIEGAPYAVVELQFVKPGKGQGLYRCRLKSMLDGSVIDRTYRSDDQVKEANVSDATMQFLYKEGRQYWFMDTTSFEQLFLNEEQIGEVKGFLVDNAVVTVMFHDANPIGVTPPTFIEVAVTRTEPTLKGAMKEGGSKPATLATGHTLSVPLFVDQGDFIRVDTRTGTYVERVGRK